MLAPPIPHTYADAIFAAKRGFVIIGLTGYTGSGCTTTARMLSKEAPFRLRSRHNEHFQNDDQLWERHYSNLQTMWANAPWQSHIVVEVGVAIIAILLQQALTENTPETFPPQILKKAEKNKERLAGLRHLRSPESLSKSASEELIAAYYICVDLLHEIKTEMKARAFIPMMQLAGDKIRLYGSFCQGDPDPKNMFIIPEAVRKLISSFKKARGASRFVVDAFRNPFEVEYFKRRYAEFYLVCLYRDPADRATALRKSLTETEVHEIWKKERGDSPTDGRTEADCPQTKENIGWWITGQNIPACAQKADVFIQPRHKDHGHLCYHLAKLMLLIQKPGCLNPSRDEHSMQIAATARLMSGCLSRQVGAAVVAPNEYVLGIGWNNPPDGQVPCSLRSCQDLVDIDEAEESAYSSFEKSESFRAHIEKKSAGHAPFCFRSELKAFEGTKQAKAEYTRALHAEENAFLQTAKVGGVSLIGSTLYTTASTCTLCAKKAYHLEIDRIVYIDEYDNRALEQTIQTGRYRISYEQFEGITGGAYHSLYSPLIPEKDLVEYYYLRR